MTERVSLSLFKIICVSIVVFSILISIYFFLSHIHSHKASIELVITMTLGTKVAALCVKIC